MHFNVSYLEFAVYTLSTLILILFFGFECYVDKVYLKQVKIRLENAEQLCEELIEMNSYVPRLLTSYCGRTKSNLFALAEHSKFLNGM